MAPPDSRQLSRVQPTALVVGSMIGSGIFALPAAFARATGVHGALMAWAVAGTGTFMLALIFQSLSRRVPALDAGIYACARVGFGARTGLPSALGCWIGCCLADVACLVLIKAMLGQFFPAFGDGTTAVALLSSAALLWGFHWLVLRGTQQAAALNTVATPGPVLFFLWRGRLGWPPAAGAPQPAAGAFDRATWVAPGAAALLALWRPATGALRP